MTNALSRVPERQSGLAIHDNEDIQLLDIRTGDLREAPKRVDVIASISFGYKVKGPNGFDKPMASKEADERWIHPHDADDAQQLHKALAAGNYRRLTISLASDEWGEFCHQYYACHSASALLIFGDQHALTQIKSKQVERVVQGQKKMVAVPDYVRVEKKVEPQKYAELLSFCKVQTSIYFYLARWVQNDNKNWIPQVVMDGNTGMYRLRTSGTHTVDNLASAVKQLRAQTGGYIRGVPLTLTVRFPEVPGPDGKKRKVAVGSFYLQPPFEITGVSFRPMLSAAVDEGQRLALPAPAPETIEGEYVASISSPPSDDVTEDEREIELIARGGRCNADRFERFYFRTVKDTEWDTDEGRKRLVREWTRGATDSLAEYLKWATDVEAQAFVNKVDEIVFGKRESADDDDAPKADASEYDRMQGQFEEVEPVSAPIPAAAPAAQPATEGVYREADGSATDTKTGEMNVQPVAAAHAAATAPVTEPPSDPEDDEDDDEIERLFPPLDDDTLAGMAEDVEEIPDVIPETAPAAPVQDPEPQRQLAVGPATAAAAARAADVPTEPAPAINSLAPGEHDYEECYAAWADNPNVKYHKPPHSKNQQLLKAWWDGHQLKIRESQTAARPAE